LILFLIDFVKLVENSHPTTELVVTLNVNHEEHMLRALADTGASNNIIHKDYTSKNIIKHNNNDTTTWSIMNAHFTTDKSGIAKFLLPEFNLKKQIT
jgi:hypothetical protein